MSQDLGIESFLGTADGELAQDLRDRLALATRYIANWYAATEDSDNKDIWWAKIDVLRGKVESAYKRLLAPQNVTFLGRSDVAAYDDASAAWASLWRELTLSPDTIDVDRLSQVADLFTTIVQTPAAIITQVGNELGKAVGGAAGGFLARAWPYLLGAGVIVAVWTFRQPLAALASKAVPA